MKSKNKIILWFAIMFAVVYIVWAIIINVQGEKLNYEIVKEGDKTYYKIDDIMYEEAKDSDMVLFETKYGIMVAELYPSYAPITVANFKKLVSSHFYDKLTFHRVIKDFMIQTGDPTATGNGGSDETIKGEFSANGVKNDLSHKRGVLSMARRGSNPETEETMNSASSQFFIVQADSTFLDGNYAGFGLLVHGYDVLDKIATVQTDEDDKPLKDQVIEKAILVNIVQGE